MKFQRLTKYGGRSVSLVKITSGVRPVVSSITAHNGQNKHFRGVSPVFPDSYRATGKHRNRTKENINFLIMYRYFKSHINGGFVVMYDNPLCGPVEDKTYKTRREAKARVKEMNGLILSKI